MGAMNKAASLWHPQLLELPRCLSSWLFAAALFASPMNSIRVGPSIALSDMLFLAAGLSAFAERLAHRERIYFSWLYLLAGVLIVSSYVVNESWPANLNLEQLQAFIDASLRVHMYPDFAQEPNLRAILAALVVFPQLFIFLRIRSYGELRTLIFIWTAGAVYGAVFTVMYCNGFFSSHVDTFWINGHRASGLTLHPNTLGMASALALPGLVMFYLQYRSLFLRALVLVAGFLIWRAISYSGSRTGLYMLFLMAGAMFALMYFDMTPRTRLRLLALGILVIGAFFAIKYISGPAEVGSAAWRAENGADSSDTSRSVIRQAAIDGFERSPIFGEGYQWVRIAHNVYLQMLQAAGLVGFAGYAMALLFPFYKAWQSGVFLRSYEDTLLRNVLLTGMFGALASGWVQPTINSLYMLIPAGLLLYLGVMRIEMKRVDRRGEAPEAIPGRRWNSH